MMQSLEDRPGRYLVQSQSNSQRYYHVKESMSAWTCDCPDNIYRSYRECKHIRAVKEKFNKVRALPFIQ